VTRWEIPHRISGIYVTPYKNGITEKPLFYKRNVANTNDFQKKKQGFKTCLHSVKLLPIGSLHPAHRLMSQWAKTPVFRGFSCIGSFKKFEPMHSLRR
jgi:hypothetical protein